jgi:hypothetical protein
MPGPVSTRASIIVAGVLLAASAALLWVPWLPLDPRAECGWTCYVPLEPGRPTPSLLQLDGRGGVSVAGLASAVTMLAALVSVGVAVWRSRLPRFAPVASVVLGIASLAASIAAILRVTGADLILVTGSGTRSRVGGASMGSGAFLALATGAGICCLGLLLLLRPSNRRAGARRRSGRAAETGAR